MPWRNSDNHLTGTGKHVNLCHICNKLLDGASYVIKEQYFGTKEEFLYRQCPSCMCLQLAKIPDDLERYYPENYYSKIVKKMYRDSPLLSKYRAFRLNIALKYSPLSYLLTKPRLHDWVYQLNINSNTKILDVGCGSGQKILTMKKKGFHFLEGVEPFIDSDINYKNSVVIHKTNLIDFVKEKRRLGFYGLIMMHHSLEHMPDQNAVFEAAHQLLSNTGKLLVRIPICSSYAWDQYKENWVQADAPRHLYLHSNESIRILADNHGFILSRQYFDSTEFQFTGSERYMKGMSLIEFSDEENVFSIKQIEKYKEMASKLNREQRGDQAVFIFEKREHSSRSLLPVAKSTRKQITRRST